MNEFPKSTEDNVTWDPLMSLPSDEALEEGNKAVQRRLEKMGKKPYLLKIKFFFFGFILVWIYIITNIFSERGMDFSFSEIWALLWFCLPALLYYSSVKAVEEDVIKKMVADKYGWRYDPRENYNRWGESCLLMSEIFNKGSRAQYIYDQFWGNYNGQDFWSGLFHYVEGDGGGSDSSDTTYCKHFFCFKLPTKIKGKLLLENSKNEGKGRLNIESDQFNKAFSIKYADSYNEKLDIVRSLSPSIQVRLNSVVREYGHCSLLFEKDRATFLFDGELPMSNHTDFILNGVKVDDRDILYLDQKLKKILELTNDILPYIR